MFELRAGDLVADKYRVERVLGAGGMGIVVAATHVHLRQRVAIKMLMPDLAARSDIVARFLREGRIARTITSEHVARVLDVGILDDAGPYLVMEYLEGTTLSALLRSGGPLEVPVAVTYVVQACAALAQAHAAGIVHRDLKSSNMFVTFDESGAANLKLLDFGISKLGGEDLTRSESLLGSPSYMSPEQIFDAKSVDHRADIWGLGIVLYEALSGMRPFVGDSVPAICMAVVAAEPAPLRAVAPAVPEALEAVVMRCLRKDRAERFQSVAEVVSALAPFAGAAGAVPHAARAEGAAVASAPRTSRAKRALALGAAAGGLFAAALVAVSVVRSRPPETIAIPSVEPVASAVVVAEPPPIASPSNAPAPTEVPPQEPPPTDTAARTRKPARRVDRRPAPRAPAPVRSSAPAPAPAPPPSGTALFGDRKW